MDIKELASKKIAGIPIIIIAGVMMIGGYLVYRNVGNTPTETPATPDENTEETVDTGDSGNGVIMLAQPAATTDSENTDTTPVNPAQNNVYWTKETVEWLIKHGYELTLAQTAISKYISGDTLSFEENKAVSAAVNQFGLPPEGVTGNSAVTSYNGPAKRQGTPPCKHIVKGNSDNSFTELARLYWNVASTGYVSELRNANGNIGPGNIPTGTTVNIPKKHEPKYYYATRTVRSASAIAKKNGTSQETIIRLNPEKRFPVKVKTRVQVA